MKYIDQDFSLFAGGDDSPDHSVIEKFEKEFGVSLPYEFREYSTSALSGIYIEAKEDIWPRPKPLDVAAFWTFLYGMVVYSFSKHAPDWMNIEIQTSAHWKANDVTRNYVPFMKIMSDPNIYFFGGDELVYFLDHEQNKMVPTGKKFLESFEDEISELRQRKDEMKEAIVK